MLACLLAGGRCRRGRQAFAKCIPGCRTKSKWTSEPIANSARHWDRHDGIFIPQGSKVSASPIIWSSWPWVRLRHSIAAPGAAAPLKSAVSQSAKSRRAEPSQAPWSSANRRRVPCIAACPKLAPCNLAFMRSTPCISASMNLLCLKLLQLRSAPCSLETKKFAHRISVPRRITPCICEPEKFAPTRSA